MEFSKEYCSGLPFPSPGDLPDPGLLHCRQILYQLNHKGSPNTQSDSLWPHGLQPSRFLSPWDFPDSTGVDCHFFLPFSRGSAPIQGSKLCLLNCRQILYHLSHQEKCALPSLHTWLLPQRWGVMKQWASFQFRTRWSLRPVVIFASVTVFSDPGPCCDTEGVGPEPWLSCS